MIYKCTSNDENQIYGIINEAAMAYEGVIPADCYHQPYMPLEELKHEMARMTFYGWKTDGEMVGVMGIEPIKDVTLIRHAYVLPNWQKQGIGSKIFNYCKELVNTSRLLVGTWADVYWAIDFYKKLGFELTTDKDNLLKTYWDISQRQIETSVVLAMNMETVGKE